MHVLLHVLTVITLCVIAWQDLHSRAVIWLLFPLLAGLGVGVAFLELGSFPLLGQYVAINCGFLLLQFAVLRTWFFIRKKDGRGFVDHVIGKGDLFFLLASACFFSPVNFILFYLFSLLFSLVLYLLASRWPGSGSRWSTVPLAGLQAGFLLLCLPVHLLLKLPLTDDSWITLKLL